ncbi:hypothetical protein EON77_12005 [bacterium]|nr:MAG: hypothetical protein EON77_12005 [bacterium]
MSPGEGAQIASRFRNATLDAARGEISEFGLQVSRALKGQGKTLPQLVEHYAFKMFEKKASALTAEETIRVLSHVIDRSGVSNPYVDALVKAGHVGAEILGAVVKAHAIHQVLVADDKLREGIKQASAMLCASLGTRAGVRIGAGGGPLGAAIGGLLGGAIGGGVCKKASEEIYDRVHAYVTIRP